MIRKESKIVVADNSGAQMMVVINIYGSTGKKFASIGDIIQCAVKKAAPHGTVKTHEMVQVVLVRTRKELRRSDGSYIRFDDNAGVIIDNKENKNPKATRVFGPIARELKERGFNKIISLAQEVY
ncbi:50S ribosomal protein L14 [Patescibacteria group bacterium]